MIRITKGGINIVCDTQADVKIAMAALTDVDEPALPNMTEAFADAPAWRVGGPVNRQREPLPPIGSGVIAHYAESEHEGHEHVPLKPKLVAVGKLQDDTRVDVEFNVPQHITVSRKNREVLDAVILFSEGVSTSSLSTLLGLKQVVVASRLQALKTDGLVAKIPHHRLWAATSLARRAKLVTG